MALKDVVDLAMCHKFTEETLQYMSCKISDHRQILQEAFPNFMLRPKHHFLEHLISSDALGPLSIYGQCGLRGNIGFLRKLYMRPTTSKMY